MVDDDGVVSWMMRDVTTLVCPAARHARGDRLGDDENDKSDWQSISGGKRGPNKKMRNISSIVDDQSATRDQTEEGAD